MTLDTRKSSFHILATRYCCFLDAAISKKGSRVRQQMLSTVFLSLMFILSLLHVGVRTGEPSPFLRKDALKKNKIGKNQKPPQGKTEYVSGRFSEFFLGGLLILYFGLLLIRTPPLLLLCPDSYVLRSCPPLCYYIYTISPI